MQNTSKSGGGGPPEKPRIRLFRPEDANDYDAGMNAREIIDRYLDHSKKVGAQGDEAYNERCRVLAGYFWAIDKATGLPAKKKTKHPGLADVVLADGITFGDCPVSNLKPSHLEDWIETNPAWKSSGTRRAKANIVNACFNWAMRGKRISDNPFTSVSYDEPEPRKPLDDKFLEKLTDVCNKQFEELATYLRLVSRRLSEVCRLDWDHIDWENGTVRVSKFKGRKRTKKDQFYCLVPEAVELLEKIKRRRQEPLSGAVFLNSRGTRWNRGTAGQHLRRLKSRHGFTDKATLHGIRHQAITEMIRNGASIKAASLQAGHGDTRVTERVYCHMENAFDEMREAANLGTKKRGQKPKDTPVDGPKEGGTP